jgi:hypothetical protein
MPIEQSPRFYMGVNLKTAASLGISLSDVLIDGVKDLIDQLRKRSERTGPLMVRSTTSILGRWRCLTLPAD